MSVGIACQAEVNRPGPEFLGGGPGHCNRNAKGEVGGKHLCAQHAEQWKRDHPKHCPGTHCSPGRLAQDDEGTCRSCGQVYALRRDGRLRSHLRRAVRR